MLAALRVVAVLLALAPLAACEEPAPPDPFAAPPERALPPADVERVYAAIETSGETLPADLDDLVGRKDHRFVAVLIEALRGSQLGLLDGRHYNAKVVALERLSGQRFGADWVAWTSWYPTTSLRAPPGFAPWKGRLLAKADPAIAPFFAVQDDAGRSEEIVWSGAPPAKLPERATVAHQPGGESALDGADPVVGVAIGNEARAYPLRWLDWHEVANDSLGSRAIAVVWCGFCASPRAYDLGAAGAPARRFAPSGLVERSVRLLYDAETRTLWNDLTGAATLGPGAKTMERLAPVPAVLTTWRAWRERNPESTVLALDAADRAVQRGAPYARYHAGTDAIFPVPITRKELPPKTLVYGLAEDFAEKAWPVDALLAARIANEAVGDTPVVLVATRGKIELEATDGERTVRFSPGAEVRAYARGTETFAAGATPDDLTDAQGTVWRATDTALVSADGKHHPRLPGTTAYWFAWQAFHPETGIGGNAE
jgi:hypothetical protein